MIAFGAAVRYDGESGAGRNRPLRVVVETDDGAEHEVFLKPSGRPELSVAGLAHEALAACIAGRVGLPVCPPFLVELSPAWIASIPNAEVRQMLEISNPIAFGSTAAGVGWRQWSSEDILTAARRQTALEVFAFDSFIENPDRKPSNPNLLVKGDQFRIIDHELALFVRGLFPQPSPWRVALQLLKRHRNIAYADETGRVPPSIVLSCNAGHAAQPGMGLADMVIRQARWTARAIDEAARQGRLLSVPNPEYSAESFTDRWPENQTQQQGYAGHLHALANGLESAQRGNVQLEDLQVWLREQFGERVVTRSVKAFNDRLGRQVKAGQHGYTPKGGLFTPAKPAIIGSLASLAPVAARAHTNMGERRFS